MFEKYTSERLLHELPRPTINFLWYLWEINNGPNETEFRISLQDQGTGCQQFFVRSTGISIIENLGCRLNAEIAIRQFGTRYFMEHY